ncbi:MAG: transketolase [Candidatus Planktophila sp.]|nr:transketolase [Candidatus Planktophila sp.]
MRDTFVKTLLEAAKKDRNIILMTGDLGYGVLDTFEKELPGQFINSGVNEQAMMGMAAGYASTGKRVFVYSIANFPTLRCLEQIRNDVCLMNNPVVVVSVGAGYGYGNQGYTHHALEDIAILRALPNMEVIVPADPAETAQLTLSIIASKRPTYLRLGKSGEPAIHTTAPKVSHGVINEVCPGKSGTLIFAGSVGTVAVAAAKELAGQGLSVAVASMPFVSTIDMSYLKKALAKGPVIVIEEHSYRGGVGAAVLEAVNAANLQGAIGLIAADQNNLSQIGDQNFLRAVNGINVENIIKKFNALVAN